MAPVSLRRLALAGMVVVLLGAAPLAQTTEPAQDDSVDAIRTRANAGDADAQFNLGAMYRTGKGVPEDFGEAETWFRKAAEQGHAGASFALGFMYVRGSGVPQDDIEGYKMVQPHSDLCQRPAARNIRRGAGRHSRASYPRATGRRPETGA